MDARNTDETGGRWATALRTATVIVLLGTLAAVWHPTKSNVALTPQEATAAADDAAPAASAAPAMSVYFPDRFPAPQGNIEQQPPTF